MTQTTTYESAGVFPGSHAVPSQRNLTSVEIPHKKIQTHGNKSSI